MRRFSKRTKKEIFLPKRALHRERLTQADRSIPTACVYMISSAGNLPFGRVLREPAVFGWLDSYRRDTPVTTYALYHASFDLSRGNCGLSSRKCEKIRGLDYAKCTNLCRGDPGGNHMPGRYPLAVAFGRFQQFCSVNFYMRRG